MIKKRIIIFMPSIEGGGVEKNLFLVSNYLSTKIKYISVITTSYKFKNKFNKKIKLILPKYRFWNNLTRRSKYFISLYLLLKAILLNKDVTVFAFQANLYCVLLCKFLGTKVIVRSNSAPDGWSKNSIKRYFYKLIIKKADKVMVNSYDFKKKIIEQFNIRPIVIYNPLNKSEIIKRSKIKIKKFFPKKKCLKIINIGRYVDQKNQITLLKSLNYLKNKINFFAIIMGGGTLKNQLNDYIHKNNIQNKVKLINFANNPFPYIKQSDLFILSSKYEGLPNVVLESIVLKKFVISSNCPTGPREILLNGKGGYLFPMGDYKKLAKKIVSFTKNQNECQRMLRNAYNQLSRFDQKKNLKKYLDLVIS